MNPAAQAPLRQGDLVEKLSVQSSPVIEINRRERFIFIVLVILLLLVSTALLASFVFLW